MFSLSIGIGTKNCHGDWIEVYYPIPVFNPAQALVEAVRSALGAVVQSVHSVHTEQCLALYDALRQVGELAQASIIPLLVPQQIEIVATFIAEDSIPTSIPEVYLKLQLLSHRLCRPHSIDLTGMFGILKNVAWTCEGAIDISELPARQLKARLYGRTLFVDSIDKFPKMTDYVVPNGVRIADTARVRMGAYLGSGTTLMHEGFCNFNAGTEGPCMIEGRISAGVFIGKHSDLGGGSSMLGTLSGGGKIVISLGNNCLIGANAGCGIPLGDRCTIEAGLYVTAGSKVTVAEEIQTVVARELAGQSDLLFIRNSVTGRIECRHNNNAGSLNSALHI